MLKRSFNIFSKERRYCPYNVGIVLNIRLLYIGFFAGEDGKFYCVLEFFNLSHTFKKLGTYI
jgi:hypothetical protein